MTRYERCARSWLTAVNPLSSLGAICDIYASCDVCMIDGGQPMSVMQEIEATHVSKDEISALDRFASTLAEPSELRGLLISLSDSVKNGTDVTLLQSDEELTPSQAAAKLKMSRAHLYKLLDRELIPSRTVGRDRRIRVRDLIAFDASRQSDRRELAERFAHADRTHRGAIEELIADM